MIIHRARSSNEGLRAVIESDTAVWEQFFELIAEGVVALDRRLVPLFANSAAKRILGLDDSLPRRLPSDELVSLCLRAAETGPVQEVIGIWFPAARTLKIKATPMRDGIFVAIEDITEEALAQRVRSEFVTHASHELKSPVASLQALAGAIREAVNDDPDAAVRFADRMLHESDRLGRLVTDLLDLSRLEESAEMRNEMVAFGELVEAELAQLQGAARSKSIGVTSNIDHHAVVRGDHQQLGTLIRNLLDNAVRYTPDGGRIRVDLVTDGASVILMVADTGVGIPLDAQSRVFERFYRVDRARSRDRGGTGLGLAIVKHVAELHDGSVDVESELGMGSTFTARFPFAAGQGPAGI